MGLPPMDDPRRDIAIAVRWLWGAAYAILALGFFALLDMLYTASFPFAAFQLGFDALLCFGCAVVYAICAIFMSQEAKWAIKTAVIFCHTQMLVAALLTMFCIIGLSERFDFELLIVSIVLGAGTIIFTLMAMAMESANRAMKKLSDSPRGFEVIMPINTPNPESNTSPRSPE